MEAQRKIRLLPFAERFLPARSIRAAGLEVRGEKPAPALRVEPGPTNISPFA